MIREITGEAELERLCGSLPDDIFTGKIASLASGYGFSYPFLRFYASDSGAVIAAYYGSAVISGRTDGETADFCAVSGFGEILLPEAAYNEAFSCFRTEKAAVMKYIPCGAKQDEELIVSPPYDEVYEILKEGFDLRYEDWYTDTCHNVRHGISEIYMLREAAAECVFRYKGTAYLSLIAVKKSERRKGLGRRLLRTIGERLSAEANEVYLICREELIPFYRKCGFTVSGGAFKAIPHKGCAQIASADFSSDCPK